MDASLQPTWRDGDREGICQTAQNLLLPDRPGPQDFILLINKRENPAYLWGNILNISYNAAVASLFERYAFFLSKKEASAAL